MCSLETAAASGAALWGERRTAQARPRAPQKKCAATNRRAACNRSAKILASCVSQTELGKPAVAERNRYAPASTPSRTPSARPKLKLPTPLQLRGTGERVLQVLGHQLVLVVRGGELRLECGVARLECRVALLGGGGKSGGYSARGGDDYGLVAG